LEEVMKRTVPFAVLMLSLALGQVAFAATGAGTQITNTATATYPDPDGGPDLTATSNQVVVTTLPVPSLTITPNGATATPFTPANYSTGVVSPGQKVAVLYTLTNTGNVDDFYTLSPDANQTSGITPLFYPVSALPTTPTQAQINALLPANAITQLGSEGNNANPITHTTGNTSQFWVVYTVPTTGASVLEGPVGTSIVSSSAGTFPTDPDGAGPLPSVSVTGTNSPVFDGNNGTATQGTQNLHTLTINQPPTSDNQTSQNISNPAGTGYTVLTPFVSGADADPDANPGGLVQDFILKTLPNPVTEGSLRYDPTPGSPNSGDEVILTSANIATTPILPGGSLSFDPVDGFTGTASFTYVARDTLNLEDPTPATYNIPVSVTGSISGRVINDLSNSAADNGTEPGINLVTLTLQRETATPGTFADYTPPGATGPTTTTDSSGNYNFANVPAGTYRVLETQPTAYSDGSEYKGTPAANTSIPASSNDIIQVVLDTTNVSSSDNIFGERGTSITGTVFNDANGNGTNNTEAGIPNVLLTLLDSNNNPVTLPGVTDEDPVAPGTQVKTDSNGNYSFLNLPAGSYTVVETQPTGYGSSTVNSVPVILVAGTPSIVDFGDTLGNVTGRVYTDTANNGVDNGNTTDPGVAGVTITLTTDGTTPVTFDVDPVTSGVQSFVLTAADGTYTLANIPVGSYTVVETQPSGYTDTAAQENNDDSEAVVVAVNGAGVISTTPSSVNFGERLNTTLTCDTLYGSYSSGTTTFFIGKTFVSTTAPFFENLASPLSGAQQSSGNAAALSSDGRYFFRLNGSNNLAYYDPATGTTTDTGVALPGGVFRMGIAPVVGGVQYGYVSIAPSVVQRFTVSTGTTPASYNPTTMTLATDPDSALYGSLPGGDIAFDAAGVGYGITRSTGSAPFTFRLWRLDFDNTANTAKASLLGIISGSDTANSTALAATDLNGIAFLGGKLYLGAGNTANNPELFEVDLQTQKATKLWTDTGSTARITDLASCNFPTLSPLITSDKTVLDVNGGSVNPGDVLEYTVTIKNTGTLSASGVKFEDNIPAGSTYVTGSTTLNGTAVADVSGAMPFDTAADTGTTINSPSQPAGALLVGAANNAVVKFSVTVNTAPVPTQVSNQGTVTLVGGTPVLTDDPAVTPGTQDPTVVPVANNQADLSLTKSVVAKNAKVGDTVTFTLTVVNAGPAAASGVVVTDVLPAGYTTLAESDANASFTGNTLTWNVGALAATGAGATKTLSFTGVVASSAVAGVYKNVAEITDDGPTTDPDSTPGNAGTLPGEDDTGVAELGGLVLLKQQRNLGPVASPVNPVPALSTASVSGKPNDVIEYCIDATNFNSRTLTGVTVSDIVPVNTTYITGSGGTLTSSTVNFTAFDLTSGQTVQNCFKVTIN
jgi:uncharacterized repeat protein (TIGR01451 family)